MILPITETEASTELHQGGFPESEMILGNADSRTESPTNATQGNSNPEMDERVKKNLQWLKEQEERRGKPPRDKKEEAKQVARKEEAKRMAREEADQQVIKSIKKLKVRLLQALKILLRMARGEEVPGAGSAVMTLMTGLFTLNNLSNPAAMRDFIENRTDQLMKLEDTIALVEQHDMNTKRTDLLSQGTAEGMSVSEERALVSETKDFLRERSQSGEL